MLPLIRLRTLCRTSPASTAPTDDTSRLAAAAARASGAICGCVSSSQASSMVRSVRSASSSPKISTRPSQSGRPKTSRPLAWNGAWTEPGRQKVVLHSTTERPYNNL